ncbi:MAG: [protein-PII] uridylyltransferase [Verrucomicrobiales bacterium]|jgi:[protein-PII] uridylyltransferase|nr:[protein-PII] uridylyltransferase [Verrucomicrobiales bacterium]
MGGYLDRVLQHAEQALLARAKTNRQDLPGLYRKFLKLEEHRILLGHNAGDGGLVSAGKRADLYTVVLGHLFQAALADAEQKHGAGGGGSARLAMVAVGGFGRGQLAPFSDIDVLFLYETSTRSPKHRRFAEEAIQQVLYLLWDIGAKVGHASRTVDEAIKQGLADFQTRTSYLETRLLAGNGELYEGFLKRLRKCCLRGREREYAEWRLDDQRKRHEKFGNTVFLQEPNVKTGCGGLRDYHNLLWVAKVLLGLDSTAALQARGLLLASEQRQLDHAYDFLLRIRNELHYIQGRAGDQLTLRLQGEVANRLRYPQRSVLRRTEALMREYYHHTRDIFLTTNILFRRMSERRGKREYFLKILPLPAAIRGERKLNRQFILRGGRLYARDGAVFGDDPLAMVRVFQLMQQHKAGLSPELEAMIRRKLGVVNGKFLWLPEVRDMLLDIVRKKGEVGRIIRGMHECGVLGKLIPEFAPLDCLVQHEFYHRYTADEHTIQCLEQLDQVMVKKSAPHAKYRDLLAACPCPEILYLALILHDTGKAANGRHHHEISTQNAVRFARRMKITGRQLQLMGFLVDHHMTITEYALRRNLDDPQTIRSFARMVQDAEKLDLLMLMTFADVQGLGNAVWSNWKEGLVWQLYHSTRDMLAGEEEFLKKAAQRGVELRERLLKSLQHEVDDAECAAHFLAMPEHYFKEADEERIAADIRQVHTFFVQQLGEEEHPLWPVIRWHDKPTEGHSEVTVVTWDRDKLFSKIAGAFAVAGLNILSADIWTRDDHIVIDRFRVCTEKYEAISHELDRKAFRETLNKALLSPTYDLGKEIIKARGRVKKAIFDEEVVELAMWTDNENSDAYTMLHLISPDRLGLLHRISKVLADRDVSLAHARITTENGAAQDTFYLTGADGKKLAADDDTRHLVRALRRALEPAPVK